MQRTFGEIVGLEPVVPCKHHPDDLVLPIGSKDFMRAGDCFLSADGKWYADDDLRFDADIEAVREVLKGCLEVQEEYVKSDEFAKGYDYLPWEFDRATPAIAEWLDDNGFRNLPDDVVDDVSEACRDFVKWKVGGEFSAPDGCDVVIYDYEFGLQEDTIEVNDYDVLRTCYDAEELEDILDSLDRDFYFARKYADGSPRVCDGYNGMNPNFILNGYPSGAIWYYLTEQSVKKALADVTIRYCRAADSKAE